VARLARSDSPKGALVAVSFFVFSCAVTRARAEPLEVGIHVEYAAPAGCPSADAFFQAIRARAPGARERAAPAPGPTFVVSIDSAGPETSGHLSFRAEDGSERERSVTGDTCEEVVSALALIAALAIDPDAAARPPAAIGGPPAPPPACPPPATVIVPAPAAPRGPRLAAPAAPASAGAFPRRSFELALGVDASLAFGVGPRPLFGTPVWLALAALASGRLRPVARIGFERASSGVSDASGPTATFTWTVGFAEICPHRWTLGSVSFEPCGLFEGGVVDAAGVNVVPARRTAAARFALGVLGRAEWSIMGPVFLDFEGGARAPLERTAYFFEPDALFYESPAVAGFGGVGVGARFP
jgi:hypothetical protein